MRLQLSDRIAALLLAVAAAPLLRLAAPPVLAPGPGQVAGGAGQEGSTPEEDEPPPTPPADELDPLAGLLPFQAERARKLTSQLHGSWQLIGYDHAVSDQSNTPVAGFMTLTENGYLHLIIHSGNPQPDLFFDDDLLLQAGVHHWRVDGDGLLQVASIMAHTNFNGPIESEPAYTLREHKIEFLLESKYLNLTRPDASRLRFERLQGGVFPATAAAQIKALKLGRAPEIRRR
ncbi:MAG: hypothetical protein AAFZ65_10225 [Planctomycetota bacterium]